MSHGEEEPEAGGRNPFFPQLAGCLPCFQELERLKWAELSRSPSQADVRQNHPIVDI
ncbi:MAG: hypothetical protein UT20_C0033G0007 [Candidatus Levybacteria bacterium GW2011_GWA1_39_11]|nr:MAG: hypothetical protein UT20_C0033G0007 [Candidatus Levybacteria bacterium GW2011_GWA1_39_11]